VKPTYVVVLTVTLGYSVVVADTVFLAQEHRPTPVHASIDRPDAFMAQPST